MINVSHISLAFLMITIIAGCTNTNITYNLNEPDQIIKLSSKLNEVSGMEMLWDSVITAVQDEKGRIYYLDKDSGTITDQLSFGKDGDYEGIAHHNGHFFVLRSDGSIFKVNREKESPRYEFKNNKRFDFEGLALDHLNNRLLVACKEHGDKSKRDYFFIYSFSLESMKYDKEPVYKIKRNQVHKKFKPSAIAVHPNGDIYILSSFSKTLLILSTDGSIKNIVRLNEQLFPQPEGITFNTDGSLFISNEKNDEGPNILKFDTIDEKN